MDFSTLRVAKYFEAWLANYRILTFLVSRLMDLLFLIIINYSEVHVYLSPVETT